MFNILASAAASNAYTLIMLAVMVAIFYFFFIRPENKKKKALEAMRDTLKTGDKITTIGGIVGNIVHIKEENVVIETSADRVRVEIAKWAIANNNTQEAAAAKGKKSK